MADDQDESQKTEEPTPKKIEEARKKGQVISSQEVKHWFMLLGFLMLIAFFSPSISQDLVGRMGGLLANLHTVPTDGPALAGALRDVAIDILLMLGLPLLMLMAFALAGNLLPQGWNASVESIKPKLEKISLLKGVKRQFSAKAIVEFVKGIFKITIVGIIATVIIVPKFTGIEQYAGLSVGIVAERTWQLSIQLLIAVLVVMTVIAGLDYLFQRYQFFKQLRMSKQDIKDEHKQSEGDPMIKSRLRQIRLERARRRMMSAVPEADVVITNPTHFAVAMKYDPGSMAVPRVVAKGVDLVAFKIREVAEANGVMVVENPPLARTLYAVVDIDQEVPPEHYRAVAEVISYVFKLQKRAMPA